MHSEIGRQCLCVDGQQVKQTVDSCRRICTLEVAHRVFTPRSIHECPAADCCLSMNVSTIWWTIWWCLIDRLISILIVWMYSMQLPNAMNESRKSQLKQYVLFWLLRRLLMLIMWRFALRKQMSSSLFLSPLLLAFYAHFEQSVFQHFCCLHLTHTACHFPLNICLCYFSIESKWFWVVIYS